MYDILIKNGTVFDGKGGAGKKQDIAIKKGKISDISQNIEANAVVIIDAKNQFIAPGFIDIQNHSDSYWTIFDQPSQESLLSQGITTIVFGNCGSSLAPLPSLDAIESIQKWHDLSGININWKTFEELLGVLKSLHCGVNVGSLIGHATLRRGLIGDRVGPVSSDEQKILKNLLSEGLRQGALGMSLGLVYAHETNASMKELIEIGSELKSENKLLSVHLRSEGKHIIDALDEAIEIGMSVGSKIKISHLKIRGKENWHLIEQVLNKIESAYHQGLNISFDVYPYSSSWSVLYTYLPKWAYEGGRNAILAKLANKLERRKILDYLKDQHHDYKQIVVSYSSTKSDFEKRSIFEIAQAQEVSCEEALMNVISSSKAEIVVFDHNLSSDHILAFVSSPLSMISTDGAGYDRRSGHLIHPRCFGTMSRFLRMVRENKLLTWEQAIKKITYEPANSINLKDRGALQVNFAADVVVFDPIAIKDESDYHNPMKKSTGITAVIVNGKVAFGDNDIVNLNGQVIT